MMLTHEPMMYAGGGFPWGLLIIGGILYFLWHKGVIGGPGRGNWQRHNGGYNGGNYPAQMPGPGGPPPAGGQYPPQQQGQPQFEGPRAWFDEWHRQAHESGNAPAHGHQAQPFTPPAPAAPSAPAGPTAPAAPTQTQTEQPPRNDQGAAI
jgi:hypothetical protein